MSLLDLYICATTYFTKVVYSSSFHWALALFICFRLMLGLAFRVHAAGHMYQKISFVVSVLSNLFTRALPGLLLEHPFRVQAAFCN